ncbi:hypothetical protein G6M87_10790 [Rhizobium rhizogenes]|uniref:hypothetical protein n=1 Tax=Rhizobium rhizogenes TaxID=359 RepID=UPI0015734AD7|nr:hypothetical protein [Rhizobium rhizogenes]NTI22343.1 hypothetical protein [Rhizobium rhizogenes]QTG05931.1 hypothetical protein G6M87_10790 [Rhizobium rhizogenes]
MGLIHDIAIALRVIFILPNEIVPGEGSFAGSKRRMANRDKERRDRFRVSVFIRTDTIAMMKFTLIGLFPHD